MCFIRGRNHVKEKSQKYEDAFVEREREREAERRREGGKRGETDRQRDIGLKNEVPEGKLEGGGWRWAPALLSKEEGPDVGWEPSRKEGARTLS